MRVSTFLVFLIIASALTGVAIATARVAVTGLTLALLAVPAGIFVYACGAGFGAALEGIAKVVEARQRHKQIPPPPPQTYVLFPMNGESRPQFLDRVAGTAINGPQQQQGVVPWEEVHNGW